MTIEGLVRRVYDERLVIEAYHMGKTKILIADDHAVVREGTRQILEQEPDLDVVAEAADGEEAGGGGVRLIKLFLIQYGF